MKLFISLYFNQAKFGRKIIQVLFILSTGLFLLSGCGATGTSQSNRSGVLLLEKWNGDYPVSQLFRLPLGQQDSPVGYIDSMETFLPIWRVFMPTEILPAVDFSKNFVIFIRNVQFYNNLAILGISLRKKTAEITVLETRSTRPIENRVVLAMAVIPRQNITAIKAGGTKVAVLNE